jgi:YD repeat-containing protein
VRDGQVIGYEYDALNRLAYKNLPNTAVYENDSGFGYDLLGRLTAAGDGLGHQQSFGYDARRRVSEASNWYGTTSSEYDLAGRRTRLTWRDGFFVTFEHLVTGEMTAVRENGGFVLASFGYDDLGRRTGLTRGNGTSTSYGYDAVSRLTGLTNELAGTANDLQLGFTYNPAGQVASSTRPNDLFAWTGSAAGTTGSAANGLNQIATHGGVPFSYDARGNLTWDGTRSYSYTAENRLATGGSSNLYYDPLGRLAHLSGSGSNFLYQGGEFIEVETASGPARRFVHGPGTDEPLVWYEGAGINDRRYLHAEAPVKGYKPVPEAGLALVGTRSMDHRGGPIAEETFPARIAGEQRGRSVVQTAMFFGLPADQPERVDFDRSNGCRYDPQRLLICSHGWLDEVAVRCIALFRGSHLQRARAVAHGRGVETAVLASAGMPG